MRSSAALIFRIALASAALAGAYFCFVFAWASYLFHQDTQESVAHAVKLVPSNPVYVARLASLEPGNRRALLKHAVALNRFDAQSWIQLGLIAEFDQHDPSLAEHDYLQAAAVDRMFLPASTLANFYFRRQESRPFFDWAQQTLSITPYSPDPIFKEMWLMTGDARVIGQHIPDRPGILLAYGAFLSREKHFDAIPQVVSRLIVSAGGRNPRAYGRDDVIPRVEDALLNANRLEPARQIWASLNRAHWISLPVPSPENPLTNGDFRLPISGRGFDWRLPATEGVVATQRGGRIHFALSGSEPERCVLLAEYLPLEPGRSYQLHWTANAENEDPPSGISWCLRSSSGKKIGSGDALSPDRSWRFRAPQGSGAFVLTLEYSRPPGSTVANGEFALGPVSLH